MAGCAGRWLIAWMVAAAVAWGGVPEGSASDEPVAVRSPDQVDDVVLPEAGGGAEDAAAPSGTRGEQPQIGVNVVPPDAWSTNWAYNDLLRQAAFIDGAWRAFTDATERGAAYPRDGYIVEPAGAARIEDTGNGLVIHAPADARERGIRVWMPGAARGADTAGFHPMYLERLEPFSVLRFQHWLAPPTSQTPSEPNLHQAAVTILLCNQVGASPWYVMDPTWSDEGLRTLAQMVKRGLDRQRPVYVEGARSSAPSVARAFAIWRDVFADDPGRVVRIAAGSADQPEATASLASELGDEGFDAIACDAWFGLAVDEETLARLDAAGELTDAALIDLLEAQLDVGAEGHRQHAELAQRYGVPLLASAAGFAGLGDPGSAVEPSWWQGLARAVHRHPRMRTLYLRHAQMWWDIQHEAGLSRELVDRGGIVYGADVGPPGADGVPGHLRHQNQSLARAPAYTAITDLAREPRLADRTTRQPEGWTPPQGEGWTAFAPSVDTRVIYVSSSQGSDDNDGRSPATPVKTPRRGYELLRDGYPDWMLLRAGDTFYEELPRWLKSGRSRSERMVVGAYGAADAPRPLFRARLLNTYWRPSYGALTVRHVAFVGLHAQAPANSDGTGIRWLMVSEDILFEDMVVAGFSTNIIAQSTGPDDFGIRDFTLRRCIVIDGASPGRGQGLYASGIDGLVVEGCVFDHNGQNPGTHDLYNHNLYIAQYNRDVTVRGNISARAASHGLQLRPGGVVESNLFAFNPLAFYVTREDSIVRNNVVLFGVDMPGGEPRGFGFDIGTKDSTLAYALIEDNIVAWNQGSMSPPGLQVTERVGKVDLINNVVHQWGEPGIEVRPEQVDERRGNRIGDPDAPDLGSIDVVEVESRIRALIERERSRPRGQWLGGVTDAAPLTDQQSALDWIRSLFAPRP